MKTKLLNYGLWLGIIATILSAGNINPETLTSWELLKDAILGLLLNPYKLGLITVAILSHLSDPTTKNKWFFSDK